MIRLAKKFNEIVKSVQEREGSVVVCLYQPYRIDPSDVNLRITGYEEGTSFTVPKEHFREALDRIYKPGTAEFTLSNDKVHVTLRWSERSESCPGFTARDKTDWNNEPTCFNRSYRNINHVLFEIQRDWSAETTMGDITEIARKYGVAVHHYCARD